ncbi:MAG TPA: L-threonylcarbamoyladenylate synthase [Polyangiaceae bacterium]|nr:L-threonylcarbamoyladenylate synthase [Polyangiaceae bacterium]
MLLAIHPDHPEPRKIRRAVEILADGGVIAYPTDTVYGLGCDLTNKHAVDRLYTIKGMDRSQPLAFVCPDLSDIARYAVVDNPVYRVLRRFLPGPYTFILEATRDVPKLFQMKRKNVGIRVPALETPRALARELGRPIVSTTASHRPSPGDQEASEPSGAGRSRLRHVGSTVRTRLPEEPFVDPHEIHEAFRGLALVLDGGVGGLVPTTVIDLTKSPPEVVRVGAGPVDEF